MTREDFEFEVENLHAEGVRLNVVRRALPVVPTAREAALLGESVALLDQRIRTLMLRTNVLVAWTRTETVGHYYAPPLVNVTQTMINFDRDYGK